MKRIVLILILLVAAALDISLRLIPSTVGHHRELPDVELPESIDGINTITVSGNDNIFGLIPDDRKTTQEQSSETDDGSDSAQEKTLENVSVSLVAIYMEGTPVALIKVKDDAAERVGSLQKVVEGEQIDGFTVQSITAKALVLASDQREVTFKVFNRQ